MEHSMEGNSFSDSELSDTYVLPLQPKCCSARSSKLFKLVLAYRHCLYKRSFTIFVDDYGTLLSNQYYLSRSECLNLPCI